MTQVTVDDKFLALRTVDGVESQMTIAGIGARGYAFIIDWHLRTVCALAVFLPLGYALGAFSGHGGARHSGLWIAGLAGLSIYLLYHPLLELLLAGRTPGKRGAGLRIVTHHGEIPGHGALLARNLFRLIDSLPLCYGVGLLVMWSNPRQLRLGDFAAATVLVYESQTPLSSAALVLGDDSLSPRTALLVAELLRRWPELDADRRVALAKSLLARTGRPHDSADEPTLLAELQQLQSQGV